MNWLVKEADALPDHASLISKPKPATSITKAVIDVDGLDTQQGNSPVFPDEGRNKKPTATLENFQALIKFMNVTVRFNELSRRCEISIPDLETSVENAEAIALAMLHSSAARYELPMMAVDNFLLVVADRNSYNPFRDYILAKPWDGVPRFNELTQCLVTPKPKLASIGLRKTMLGAIAGAFSPSGLENPPPVLTLTGKQNAGKTTFFRELIPNIIQRGFLEGITLDPSNKDSVMEATSHNIVELGELDSTFRRSDIAKLKAFLTRHKDTYREPYGKRDATRPRRSVFVATVNDERFLVDSTGNRRFLVVEVTDIKRYEGERQQVWAEVYRMYLDGERPALTREETAKLELHNSKFTQHDEIHDLVSERLKWVDYSESTAAKFTYKTATDITLCVGDEARLKTDKATINRVAAMVRKFQELHHIPTDKRTDRSKRYLVPI